MREEIRTQTIPERVEKKIVYIANDGKEFDTLNECKKYELFNKNVYEFPVIKNRIFDAYSLDPNEYINDKYLFYISNKDDYDIVLCWYGKPTNYLDTDYNKYGNGWYIFYFEKVSCPNACLYNYDNYVKRYTSDLKASISHNQTKINEIEKKMKNEEKNEK